MRRGSPRKPWWVVLVTESWTETGWRVGSEERVFQAALADHCSHRNLDGGRLERGVSVVDGEDTVSGHEVKALSLG